MTTKSLSPILAILFACRLLEASFEQSLPSLPDGCRPAALATADVDKDGLADLIVRCETFQGTLHYFYRGNADSIFPNGPQAKKHKQEGSWSYLPFYSPQGPVQDPGAQESPDLKMQLNSDAIPDTVSIRYGGQIVLDLSAPNVIFTVNSTADPGNGVCDAVECTLREAINAANATATTDVIYFNLPFAPYTIAPTTVLPTITQPLTIDGTSQPGYAGSPIVEVNGTNVSGFFDGLTVNSAGFSLIRGIVINRFAGSGINLYGSGITVVDGNFLGTDISGTIDLGNGTCGVQIYAAGNQIGSVLSGRNVISGNSVGICIAGEDSDNNKIFDNFIGTTADGSSDLGNDRWGISIFSADGTIIGGSITAVRNVISGNGDESGGWPAIVLGDNASQTEVQGNFIGTSVNGTADLGNGGEGIWILDCSQNTIAGNVISGNTKNGIQISGQSLNNEILGNLIGTDVNGTTDIGNSGGISLGGVSNTIIGTNTPGEGNVIAANGSGVSIEGGSTNFIVGNWIGTDKTGTINLGNTSLGIHINNSTQNEIENNVVAYNAAGINITTFTNPSTGNLISKNSFFANGSFWAPIDLGGDQATLNDVGDGDTGPNNFQNFPELTSFTSDASSTSVQGTLNSAPNIQYSLEFFSSPSCHATNHGPGKTFIGTATVITDVSGNVSFDLTLPNPMPTGEGFLTATATNLLTNDTSEYSACLSNQVGLLFDDFEDNELTWNVVKGNWGESAGSLIAFDATKNSIYAPLPWPDSGVSGCTMCTIETDVATEGGEFGRLFIVVWFQSNKNKVELVMKEKSDKCILKEKVNGVLTNKAKAEFQILPNVVNHIAISFDGTNYQVAIDGQPLITMPASATPFGNVGFRSKNTSAWFQQVLVQ